MVGANDDVGVGTTLRGAMREPLPARTERKGLMSPTGPGCVKRKLSPVFDRHLRPVGLL
jgi:hypothetical protein